MHAIIRVIVVTDPQTNTGTIRIHCAAASLARSVIKRALIVHFVKQSCNSGYKRQLLYSCRMQYNKANLIWWQKICFARMNRSTFKKCSERCKHCARAVCRKVRIPPARLPARPLSQTHRQDRLQYTAPQLASSQCNDK